MQRAVNRLSQKERQILVMLYMQNEEMYDYEVYAEMRLSQRSYYRTKAKAFYRLTLLFAWKSIRTGRAGMNFVQPIRDPECIFYIKRFLKEQSERNYMLFVTGINSGLRISDILELRVRDAKLPYFNLIEKKTKRKRELK